MKVKNIIDNKQHQIVSKDINNDVTNEHIYKNECIGFQLLKFRAEKETIEVNVRKINILKRKLLVALEEANKEYRTCNKYLSVEKKLI